MNKITRESVYDILSDCGFAAVPGKPGLFLVEEARTVTPAYYCSLLRRRGKVQLSGGVGLFFREFEEMWRDSISKEDRRIDATLPVGMLIDNYLELIDGAALRYYGLEDLKYAACQIYGLASRLPASPIALDKALSEGKLLGKPISSYLHIFGYHEDDNLYFRKSVCFVHWFMEKFPHYASHMRQCLTRPQLQRLGLMRA
jgi:hypothetical protein